MMCFHCHRAGPGWTDISHTDDCRSAKFVLFPRIVRVEDEQHSRAGVRIQRANDVGNQDKVNTLTIRLAAVRERLDGVLAP